MKQDKEKVEVLSTDISDDEISLKYDVLSANLVDDNDRLTTGISQLTSGVTDVLVNGESVVEGSIAYVNVTTAKYVDEKVAAEAACRQAADDSINATVKVVDEKLDAEIEAREIADNILNAAIGAVDDKVEAETAARQAADEVLNTAIKNVDTKLDTKIAEVRDEMSIIHQETQEQLSLLNTKIDTGLSTLDNKINEVDIKLSTSKLSKDLSVLDSVDPGLTIESRDNLLVYLYNTEDKKASKAKLSEISYWDELR